MNITDQALQILARQLGEDNASSRAALEAKLVPLLCLVLRTGRGRPSLVQWVRRALPALAPAPRSDGQVDPEWAAPRLARLLLAQLLGGVRASRDTIAIGQTVAAG